MSTDAPLEPAPCTESASQVVAEPTHKHPAHYVTKLGSPWSLWTVTRKKKGTILEPACDFDTLEAFFDVYSLLKPFAELEGTSLQILRSQANPDWKVGQERKTKYIHATAQWEDPNNAGEFRIALSPDTDIAAKQVDVTVLGMIGESFKYSHDIFGICLRCKEDVPSTLSLFQHSTSTVSSDEISAAWIEFLAEQGYPSTEQVAFSDFRAHTRKK